MEDFIGSFYQLFKNKPLVWVGTNLSNLPKKIINDTAKALTDTTLNLLTWLLYSDRFDCTESTQEEFIIFS